MWKAPGIGASGNYESDMFDVGGRLLSVDPVGGSPRRTVFMNRPLALVEGYARAEMARDRAALCRAGHDGALLRLRDGTIEARPAHGWQVGEARAA